MPRLPALAVLSLIAGAFYGLLLVKTPAAQAAGDDAVGNCVRVRDIRASKILDDRRVLLEMRSGPALVMMLKRPCPQLAFHDYFSYEARLGQLCAEIDHIVSRAGFMCDIGSFALHKPDATKGDDAGSDG